MIKKYLGITLVATSMLMLGCSSNDDDGMAGEMATADAGAADAGAADAGAADAGAADAGAADAGAADGGNEEIVRPPMDYGNSVMGIVAAQPDTMLAENAIRDAEDGLDQTLNDPTKSWTFFAPIDSALEGITADRAALLMHIHAAELTRDALIGLVGSSLSMTGAGDPLPITMNGEILQIGGVDIVQGHILGDNGTVFKIDGVLQ